MVCSGTTGVGDESGCVGCEVVSVEVVSIGGVSGATGLGLCDCGSIGVVDEESVGG